MTEADVFIHDFYFNEMKFCGCYDPDLILKRIEERLEDLEWREWSDNQITWLYQLDAWGLIEHGTSIRGSWITPKGMKVLRAIKDRTETWFE